MRTICVLMLFFLLAACSSGSYLVEKKEYEQRVRTLGVLPVLLSGTGEIHHPQAQQVVGLLRKKLSGAEKKLIKELRKGHSYFDVRLAKGNSKGLLTSLKRDGLGRPLSYAFDSRIVAKICRATAVDALLVLVVQAGEHKQKRWSRNTFESLTDRFDDLQTAAMVVAADGRELWRFSGEKSEVLLALQYADFDEAYYNHTDKVRLKYIRPSGLEKTLDTRRGPLKLTPINAWIRDIKTALSPLLPY